MNKVVSTSNLVVKLLPDQRLLELLTDPAVFAGGSILKFIPKAISALGLAKVFDFVIETGSCCKASSIKAS